MQKKDAIKHVLLVTLLSTLFCFTGSNVASAQTNLPENEPLESNPGFLSCETWILYIADAMQKAGKDNDRSLIVISRLGKKEISRRLSLKRLTTLKKYMLFLNPKAKIVFADGERAEDNGIIEFYIEGKLFYSLPVDRNRDVGINYCEFASNSRKNVLERFTLSDFIARDSILKFSNVLDITFASLYN